jgi:zinc transport system substrate-binding protein
MGALFLMLAAGAGVLAAAPLRVGVSVLPLESIVEAIGGEAVAVRSLAREGDSCSVFEPRPSAVSWLAESRLFFRTGVGYETVILEKVESRFAGLKVVDLRDAVALLPLSSHSHPHPHPQSQSQSQSPPCATCAACGGHASDPAGDPHIWLDPRRLAQLADLIAAELGAILPERAAEFRSRAAVFKAQAAALDAELERQLAPHAGKAFFIYHPALGYFAERYGLRQVAIADGGGDPSARALHARIAQARAAAVRTIFIQPQESRKQAEVIARAVGAELVEIDPMARDWAETLRRTGAALADALGEQG